MLIALLVLAAIVTVVVALRVESAPTLAETLQAAKAKKAAKAEQATPSASVVETTTSVSA